MIGERVGNYVIKQQLGEGGMGQVFLAEHPQIGKRVALKVLHAELSANQDIATRFFHEAKAVNDIAHPNIVDILDFGTARTSRGEVMYLVMELLTGSTLTSIIEKGPLDPQRTTRIALQVADALAASHAKGIIHRDLKPDNIMLVQRGREEAVKLLDFGIAKVTASGASTKTRTGMVMGTPTYMSPEQCEGRGSIDHRTDIYALGIVLYEMLTGRVPFTGSGYGEILVKQMTEPPMPMSSVRPGIPAHLEQIVLKALQKRPEDRFQTMHELATALSAPEQYVNAHGGLAGFLPNAPVVSATPTAATVMVQPTPSMPPHPTTLSASTGQMATPAPAMPSQIGVQQGRSKLPLVIGGVIAAAAASVLAVVTLSGGDSKPDTTAAASSTDVTSSPDPSPPPTPPTPPADPPTDPAGGSAPSTDVTTAGSATQVGEPAGSAAPPSDPPPPPAPATVKLTIDTQPPGAEVYVGRETKPRCTTPCDVEAPRSDREETLRVKLAGYTDLTRTVSLGEDQKLALDLVRKKSAARPTSKPTKQTKPGPIGDNTLNPFE